MGLIASERVFTKYWIVRGFYTQRWYHLPKTLNGKVEFQSVGLLMMKKNCVLDDINFTIEIRTNLCFSGSAGSGKSTIINILNRFMIYRERKYTN
ncbi:MAG: hypothetical protein IPN86_04285 [Saprospiraceae bacterium]|nr:hypothetical protein [Saprospiraceae bacterium]